MLETVSNLVAVADISLSHGDHLQRRHDLGYIYPSLLQRESMTYDRVEERHRKFVILMSCGQ